MSNNTASPAPAIDYTDLVAPFDADGILCVQDGKITPRPDPERDWTEYHLEHMHSDVWRIERSDAAELCSFVYQGRIPSREYFVALMTNQETPLPDGWATDKGEPPGPERKTMNTTTEETNQPTGGRRPRLTPLTCSAKYDAQQVAEEIRITASGAAYYGNALYVALDMPCISANPDQKAAIQRYLRGTQNCTDHIRLQEAAMVIWPNVEVSRRHETNEDSE